MRRTKRKVSMAGAIYLIIGVLALMACVSITMRQGDGDIDNDTSFERSVNKPDEEEQEDDDETL